MRSMQQHALDFKNDGVPSTDTRRSVVGSAAGETPFAPSFRMTRRISSIVASRGVGPGSIRVRPLAGACRWSLRATVGGIMDVHCAARPLLYCLP